MARDSDGTGSSSSGFYGSFRSAQPLMDKSHRGRTMRPLQPDDLRMAADAFEAALRHLDESVPVDPFTSRRMLARYVIEHMFDGERDLEQLYKGALDHLRRVGSAQTG